LINPTTLNVYVTEVADNLIVNEEEATQILNVVAENITNYKCQKTKI